MFEVLASFWWLIVALGLLITFHEFGHYWVARRCGVRVLRFSVGFGKPLFKRTGKNGTQFVVAALPLGGYVKMLDEREGPVDPDQRDQAFNNKTLAQRSAIIAAGPVFNLIFALAAFWLMLVVGIPENRPLLGPVSGVAAEAGLADQDIITRVDARPVISWTDTILALVPPALDRRSVMVTAEGADGRERELRFPLERLTTFRESEALDDLGLAPWRPAMEPVIAVVRPGSPADQAGLATGDRIIAIDGQPVDDWSDIGPAVREYAQTGGALQIEVARDGRTQAFELIPQRQQRRWIIGIEAAQRELTEAERAIIERAGAVVQYGPLAAVPESISRTWRYSASTLGIMARMVTGRASLDNLAGPITIANVAKQTARLGFSRFLWFLGIISLTLCIVNLLPVPMLDGGHLLYNLIEWTKGSPVSERAQIVGQYFGLVLIAGLMSLAIFNDILRLF